jgi:hypothetical protein
MKTIKKAVNYVKKYWKYLTTYAMMLFAGGVAISQNDAAFAFMFGMFAAFVNGLQNLTIDREKMTEILEAQDRLILAYRKEIEADEVVFERLTKLGVFNEIKDIPDEEKN